MENNSTTFTLFQWNTLCHVLAQKKSFPYSDIKCLDWKYREPLIKKIIEENKPDIICLQEVGNFEDRYKEEILGKGEIKYDLLYDRSAVKMMGNVIGVNKELFELEKMDINIIREGPDKKKRKINMITAIITDKKTNNKFILMCIHLTAKEYNEKIRRNEIEEIMKYIEENLLGKYPIILIGDFNSDPDSETITALVNNEKIKIKSVFDNTKVKYTTLKLRETLVKRTIDYIFYVGKDVDNTDKEIEIVNKEIANPEMDEGIGVPNANFPSDHLFLKATVKLNYS